MNIHYKGNIYIDYQYQSMTPGFIGSVSDFEEHVSTITHYLYIGDEKLKDGQQVFEGVDYELKKIGIVDDEFVELMGGKEIFEAIGIPKVTHEGEEQVIYDSGRMRSEKTECICTYPEKMLHGNKNCPVHGEKTEESKKFDVVILDAPLPEKETQEDVWNEVFRMIPVLLSGKEKSFFKDKFLITRK